MGNSCCASTRTTSRRADYHDGSVREAGESNSPERVASSSGAGGAEETRRVRHKTISLEHVDTFNAATVVTALKKQKGSDKLDEKRKRYHAYVTITSLQGPSATVLPSSFGAQIELLSTVELTAPATLVEIGDRVLSRCPNLRKVTFDPTFKKVSKVGHEFLAQSSSLYEIDLRPLCNVTSIGERFMEGCWLPSIIHFNGASSLCTLGSSSFPTGTTTTTAPEWRRNKFHGSDASSASSGNKSGGDKKASAPVTYNWAACFENLVTCGSSFLNMQDCDFGHMEYLNSLVGFTTGPQSKAGSGSKSKDKYALPVSFMNGSCGSGIVDYKLTGLNKMREIGRSGVDLLTGFRDLKTLKIQGLNQLVTVEGNFITLCPKLQEIEFLGQQRLRSIGNRFLFRLRRLTVVSLVSLTQLEEIGDFFLASCSSLQHLDLSHLVNLRKIGDQCLKDCLGLASIDLQSLDKLTSVGEEFLANTSRVKEVDLSGMQQLAWIGTSFLAGCGVRDIDLSVLTDLKTVGADLLLRCEELNQVVVGRNSLCLDREDLERLRSFFTVSGAEAENAGPSILASAPGRVMAWLTVPGNNGKSTASQDSDPSSPPQNLLPRVTSMSGPNGSASANWLATPQSPEHKNAHSRSVRSDTSASDREAEGSYGLPVLDLGVGGTAGGEAGSPRLALDGNFVSNIYELLENLVESPSAVEWRCPAALDESGSPRMDSATNDTTPSSGGTWLPRATLPTSLLGHDGMVHLIVEMLPVDCALSTLGLTSLAIRESVLRYTIRCTLRSAVSIVVPRNIIPIVEELDHTKEKKEVLEQGVDQTFKQLGLPQLHSFDEEDGGDEAPTQNDPTMAGSGLPMEKAKAPTHDEPILSSSAIAVMRACQVLQEETGMLLHTSFISLFPSSMGSTQRQSMVGVSGGAVYYPLPELTIPIRVGPDCYLGAPLQHAEDDTVVFNTRRMTGTAAAAAALATTVVSTFVKLPEVVPPLTGRLTKTLSNTMSNSGVSKDDDSAAGTSTVLSLESPGLGQPLPPPEGLDVMQSGSYRTATGSLWHEIGATAPPSAEEMTALIAEESAEETMTNMFAKTKRKRGNMKLQLTLRGFRGASSTSKQTSLSSLPRTKPPSVPAPRTLLIPTGFGASTENLTRLVLEPSLGGGKHKPVVTVIENGFLADCPSLLSASLPTLCTVTSIGDDFMAGCVSLTSIGSQDEWFEAFQSVRSIGKRFLGGTLLDAHHLHLDTLIRLTSITGFPLLCDMKQLTVLPLGRWSEVQRLRGPLVARCPKLKSLAIAGCRNVSACGGLAIECGELQEVKLAGLAKGLSVISHHFLRDNTSLNSLRFALPHLRHVVSIGHNFLAGCTALAELDLSPLRSLTTIGNDAFVDCVALSKLSFQGCTQLKSIGDRFGQGTMHLSSVSTKGLKSLSLIGAGFFQESGLRFVELVDLNQLDAVGADFLADCVQLRTVDGDGCIGFSPSVTNARRPGNLNPNGTLKTASHIIGQANLMALESQGVNIENLGSSRPSSSAGSPHPTTDSPGWSPLARNHSMPGSARYRGVHHSPVSASKKSKGSGSESDRPLSLPEDRALSPTAQPWSPPGSPRKAPKRLVLERTLSPDSGRPLSSPGSESLFDEKEKCTPPEAVITRQHTIDSINTSNARGRLMELSRRGASSSPHGPPTESPKIVKSSNLQNSRRFHSPRNARGDLASPRNGPASPKNNGASPQAKARLKLLMQRHQEQEEMMRYAEAPQEQEAQPMAMPQADPSMSPMSPMSQAIRTGPRGGKKNDASPKNNAPSPASPAPNHVSVQPPVSASVAAMRDRVTKQQDRRTLTQQSQGVGSFRGNVAQQSQSSLSLLTRPGSTRNSKKL